MTEQTATPSRSKKFIRDLGFYAIGNLGSKLITFLLVPLYTYYITNPEDFGYYDICLTIIFGIVPVVSMQLGESSFRFLLEYHDTEKRRQVITYLTTSLLRNSAIVIALTIAISLFLDIRYIYLIMAFGLVQTYYDVALQVTRGLGHTKTFMAAGVLNSTLVALNSILFIVLLDTGILGLFYANILARSIAIIFIECRIHVFATYFKPGAATKETRRQMLKYSLPLLPAVLIWWILNSSNVFFIQQYLGLEENGIYAILAKFTGILYILSLIFYQTWQQNAIEQYNTPNRDHFFSQVFNSYLFLLCGLALFFPFLLRLNYNWLVGSEYRSSAQYLYYNSIYIVFYALAAFYELGYQCSKNTSRILPSFILITVIGITFNFILVRPLGIYGIITSNIITYSALLIYRIIDTRKYMHITFYPDNLKAITVTILGGIVYYLCPDTLIVNIATIAVLGTIYILITPPSFRGMILNKLKKRPA